MALAQQSPVDIAEYTFAAIGDGNSGGNSALTFDYANAADRIANTGDFVRVRYDNGASIRIDGDEYRLEYRLMEAHFHAPGEHAVQGEHFALETHLVHFDESGNIAVVGVLYRLGKANETLQAVIDNAPGQGENDAVPSSPLAARAFLPESRHEGLGYYAYIGSLTTPPYTEGVRWFVLSDVLEVSEAQARQIAALTGGCANNRELQPLNGRRITAFMPCCRAD